MIGFKMNKYTRKGSIDAYTCDMKGVAMKKADKKVTKFVCVNFRVEGYHYYKEAGEKEELEDVSFLQYKHRHMFHFTVKVEVTENNREIEFIQLLHKCQSFFNDNTISNSGKSCEMFCDELYEKLVEVYGKDRKYFIACYEDGENGCEATYE